MTLAIRSATAAMLAAAVLAPSVAQAQKPPAPARDQCFRSHDYQSFRPVDDHTFNIRVNVNDFYRIETQGTCPELTYPQALLITVVRGSDMICGPVDWDLRVGQPGPGGFATPCIVKSQRKLTPEEVAAIPKGQKP